MFAGRSNTPSVNKRILGHLCGTILILNGLNLYCVLDGTRERRGRWSPDFVMEYILC
jgi:hypothetical protein